MSRSHINIAENIRAYCYWYAITSKPVNTSNFTNERVLGKLFGIRVNNKAYFKFKQIKISWSVVTKVRFFVNYCGVAIG